MKINSLLEFETASSSPLNATTSAPHFGRSDKFLEDDKKTEKVEETTAGSIATVATPIGGTQRRGKGSLFQGIKTSKKFANSQAVKESEETTDEGLLGFGSSSKPQQQQSKKPLDYAAVRQMSKQAAPLKKVYRPEEYMKQYGAFAEEELDEVNPHDFDSDEDYYDAVRNQGKKQFSGDWDVWDEIASLENQLKYTKSSALAYTLHQQIDKLKRDNGIEDDEDEEINEKSKSQAQFRTMAAVAHNPEFAKKVGISQKVGKEFHSADKKQDYKDLPAKVEAANPAQQAAIAIAKKKKAQGVAEGRKEDEEQYRKQSDQAWKNVAAKDKGPIGRFATRLAAKMDGSKLFGNKAYYVSSENGETAAGSKEEAEALVAKLKKAGLLARVIVRRVKEGMAEAGEWTKLPNGNWRNMHTGAQQSTPPKTRKPRRTMGLHASLEQHADDKMKELGHKFKPVDEARVGNRMSDISIGSPKIVHYKGKAVGEVGIDHEASPGNGPFYMKHYLTGKDMVGYPSKKEALADLKHVVMQYEGSELEEEKQRLDPKCWTGYKKQGTKMKGDTRVNNCVPIEEAELTEEDMLANELFKQLELFKQAQDKGLGSKPQDKGISSRPQDKDIISKDNGEYNDEAGMADNNLETLKRAVDGIDELINSGDNLPEWCQEKIAVAKSMLVTVWDYMASEEHSEVDEDWQKVNKHDKTDGMSPKAVKAYRRENPGSKLKTAVTTKPSKLKKGSKAANRRKSFCARMSGMKKAHASAKTKRDPDSPINKALRRWNCESVEQMKELIAMTEQYIAERKK